MALTFQALFVALTLVAYGDAAGIGNVFKLSRIGKTFRRLPMSTRGLERSADMAGYTFGIVGAYWRSNTLAAYAQMSRGEIQEAMETIQLAIATLTVWDLGQGIAYPVVHKLVDRMIKNKQLFGNTIQAFDDYRNIMKTGVLDDATRAATPDALKAKLLRKKRSIGNAFQTDVTKIIQKSQLYTDLVTDLRGIKNVLKVVKWTDVILGPLFDAATVGVSAWQLAEAIKNKDGPAIAASSLSLASGLAGITGFVVSALATTGSTLAAVAGPVGALVGAILGLAAIMVEIFTALNPYRQIESHVKMIRDLTDRSKKLLDRNIKDLPNLVPQRDHFEFSWVYEVNQGLMIENIQGRLQMWGHHVTFKPENPSKEKNGYLVIGPERHLDKSKYPGNFFWNPTGLENIGYDFYGKKVTDEFKGATVIVNTNLIAGKASVELKGLDITTYMSETDDKPDNVIIDDMYDVTPLPGCVTVKTGAGDDVIQINGLVGKPRILNSQLRPNPNRKAFFAIRSAYGRYKVMQRNNDVLSFEGMPKVQKRDHKILGVEYEIFFGKLHYRVADDQGRPVSVYWGFVEGIKMFVGTPYNDIVDVMLGGMFFIRQTKGQNVYKLYLHPVLHSRTTIDDQSKTPGKIILESRSYQGGGGKITNRCLQFSKDDRTLYIYEDKGQACAEYSRARIVFSKRASNTHLVRTEADGIEMTLEQLRPKTSDAAMFDAGGNTQYFSDSASARNRSYCQKANVALYPPHPHQSKFVLKTIQSNDSKGALILSSDFINSCMHKSNMSVLLVRSFDLDRPSWRLKFFVPRDQYHVECPGNEFELPIVKNFARLMEERNDGEDRLVADLRHDKRIQIDVNAELAKLDNRQSYHFDKEFEGEVGVSQDLLLKPPITMDPPSTLTFQLDVKGGRQWDPDALIFTDELRNWLKENGRRILLINELEGAWKLQITKGDDTPTHSLNLKNIERIDYEPRDGSLRQPIVLDLATEVKKRIDLETTTVHDLLTETDSCMD